MSLSRFTLYYGLPTLAVAALVHVAVIWATPRLVMRAVMRGAAATSGINAAYFPDRADSSSRRIPLPSPDLLYATCVLDVSRGPVLATVLPGHDYLSLAVFDAASDNIFVSNDQHDPGLPIRLVILRDGAAPPKLPKDVAVVHIGTARGLLLLRALAATPELASRNDAARHTLGCARTG
jgi:uncharacterized membrane protein